MQDKHRDSFYSYIDTFVNDYSIDDDDMAHVSGDDEVSIVDDYVLNDLAQIKRQPALFPNLGWACYIA